MSAEITDDELVRRLPNYPIDPCNRAFYQGWLRRQLTLQRCTDCGHWHHPPRPMCPDCWSWNVTAQPVTGRGTVVGLSRLHRRTPVDGSDPVVPHPVVLVDLAEQPGLRLSSTVVDAEQGDDRLRIGAAVELCWLLRDGEPYPAFRLGGGA